MCRAFVQGEVQRHADRGSARGDGRNEPELAVFDRDAVADLDAESFGRAQIGLRVRLRVLDVVTRDHHAEHVVADGRGHLQRHAANRHRYEGDRDARRPQLIDQLARTRSPRHAALDLQHDAVGEGVDDLIDLERDARLLQNDGRLHEARADELHALSLAPGAAVLGDQVGLGAHPVGLGVDDRAVHVPQNGGRS